MLKKETFNLEDSNCAGLGGDVDKKCREAAAATEKVWAKAGKKPGLQIWRIEKFKVKASKTDHGTFYNDDSYICLNTYEKPDDNKLYWDIHFWLGETTSQDEAGTAAYKTVELDDFLGGGPVQHREVSGHESSAFLDLFKDNGGIRLLEGGVASGFNVVKPEEYRARLLHLKGRKNIRVSEVSVEYASMNSGDVFILDKGLDIYQWQGKKAGKNEKARAGQLCRALDDERRGKPEVHVYGQTDKDIAEFYCHFAEYKEGEAVEISDESVDDAEWEKKSDKILMQLSDASGTMEFKEVAKVNVKRSQLDSKDVFVFDIGNEVFVWIGKDATAEEKKGGLQYAGQYLKDYKRPSFLPITKILEGQDSNAFYSSFDRE